MACGQGTFRSTHLFASNGLERSRKADLSLFSDVDGTRSCQPGSIHGDTNSCAYRATEQSRSRRAEVEERGVHIVLRSDEARKQQRYATLCRSVYILRLQSGNLYIGSSTNLQKRYQDHLSGKECRTTKIDPPVGLMYSETMHSFSKARKREAQVKRWTRAKKEVLVSGDLDLLKKLSESKRILRKPAIL